MLAFVYIFICAFFFFFNVTKVERSFVLFIVYHFNTANQHLYSHYITNTESPNMLFEYMCSHFCVVSHTLSEVIFEYSLICCDPQSSEDDSESSLLCCDTYFQRWYSSTCTHLFVVTLCLSRCKFLILSDMFTKHEACSHDSPGHNHQQGILGVACADLFTWLIRKQAVPCPSMRAWQSGTLQT